MKPHQTLQEYLCLTSRGLCITGHLCCRMWVRRGTGLEEGRREGAPSYLSLSKKGLQSRWSPGTRREKETVPRWYWFTRSYMYVCSTIISNEHLPVSMLLQCTALWVDVLKCTYWWSFSVVLLRLLSEGHAFLDMWVFPAVRYLLHPERWNSN